ncbi:DUF2399 domain-containing protein [Streptomyces globisporus]|uniref:DUF2399 domain-containing protein n=1 Tax=Streptomyces globisporus TaxID=1908 RepID=UPI0037ADEFEA
MTPLRSASGQHRPRRCPVAPPACAGDRIMHRHGGEPWHMRAAGCEDRTSRTQVRGTLQIALPVISTEVVWDAELASAVSALGIGLHEEVAPDLLRGTSGQAARHDGVGPRPGWRRLLRIWGCRRVVTVHDPCGTPVVCVIRKVGA